MPRDMNIWRKNVIQATRGIADEAMQRRAWFGIGPEVSSPEEEFCQLLDDTDIEELLEKDATGFNEEQIQAARHLTALMRRLSDETPQFINPYELIDDPRWIEIRKAAAAFLKTLQQ